MDLQLQSLGETKPMPRMTAKEAKEITDKAYENAYNKLIESHLDACLQDIEINSNKGFYFCNYNVAGFDHSKLLKALTELLYKVTYNQERDELTISWKEAK